MATNSRTYFEQLASPQSYEKKQSVSQPVSESKTYFEELASGEAVQTSATTPTSRYVKSSGGSSGGSSGSAGVTVSTSTPVIEEVPIVESKQQFETPKQINDYAKQTYSATAVIQRARGGIEYYREGKLVGEETGNRIGQGEAVLRQAVFRDDSGNLKVEKPLSSQDVAMQQKVYEYETSIRVNNDLQKEYEKQLAEYNAYIQEAQKNSLLYQSKPEVVKNKVDTNIFSNLRKEGIVTPTSITEFSLSNDYLKSDYPRLGKEREFRQKIISEKNPLKVYGMVTGEALKDVSENRIAQDVALAGSTFVPVVNFVTIPLALQRASEDFELLKGGKEYRNYYFGNTPLSEDMRRDVATMISQQSKEAIESYKTAPSSLANLGIGKKEKRAYDEGEYVLGVDVASLRKVGRFAMGDFFATREEDKKKILKNVNQYFLEKGYSPVEAERLTEFALREVKGRERGMFAGIISINAKSNKLATNMYQKASEKFGEIGVAKVEGGFIKEVGSKGLTAVQKKIAVIKQGLPVASAYEGATGTYLYEKSSEDNVNVFDVFSGGVVGGISGTVIQLGTEVPATFLKEKGAKIILKSGQPLGSGKGFIYNVGKQVGLAGKGIGKGSSFSAYAVDIFGEPLGDIADFATSGVWKGVKVRPKTSVFTQTDIFSVPENNPFTKTQSKSDIVSSKQEVMIRPVSKPITPVKPKSLELPVPFVKSNPLTNPKSEPLVKPVPKPNQYPIVKPSPFEYPITLPKSNPLTNPKSNPFTNPKPNPKPEPKPNIFTGGELPLLFPSQSFNRQGFGSFDLKSKKKKYTPSLVAVAFNIKGRKNLVGEATGFGIRPIEINKKKKVKRGKR